MDALTPIEKKTLKFLKGCRGSLTPQQYRTLKGQVLAGNLDAALKGIEKLLKRSADGLCKEKSPQNFYTFIVQQTKAAKTLIVTNSVLKAEKLLEKGLRLEVWKNDQKIETIYFHTKAKIDKYLTRTEATP
jgi:hypothetical protein